MFTKYLYSWISILFIFIGIILINIIAKFNPLKYDATEDKRYSLADGSINFLLQKGNIESRISIKIYLEGNLPSEIKKFQTTLESKLKDFKEILGDRIEYIFIDPNVGSDREKYELHTQLLDDGKGILPMKISYLKDGEQRQVIVWPGATISYSSNGINNESVIQFLPGSKPGAPYNLANLTDVLENAQNNLEYNLISAIRKLTQKEKKRIAFLHGHGELNIAQTQRTRALISPYFKIKDITLIDSIGIYDINSLNDIEGLIIADPQTPFSDKDLYLIDQFVMKGGKLMCFMNTLQINEDTLMKNWVVNTMRKNLRLENMLFEYGLKLNENYVKDIKCVGKIVPFKEQIIPWFYHVLARPSKHPITRNIEPVSLKYANEIQLIPKGNIALCPILNSSSNSTRTGLAPLVSLSLPMERGKNPKLVENPDDKKNELCLAGLAEGYFQSYFINRLPPDLEKNPDFKFKSKGEKKGKVILVGNGQCIANKYDSIQKNPNSNEFIYIANPINDLKIDPELYKRKIPLFYGNQEFFQNIVDYMMGDFSLLDIRSRQIDIKKIDKEKVKVEAEFYKIINTILPISLILLLAFVWNLTRKKRYLKGSNSSPKKLK